MSKLTQKQENFVQLYCGECRFNATKAAIQAGYSEKSAAAIGEQNLRKLEISARVKEVLAARVPSPDAILAELADVGLSEWRDYVKVKTGHDGEVVEVRMDLRSKV